MQGKHQIKRTLNRKYAAALAMAMLLPMAPAAMAAQECVVGYVSLDRLIAESTPAKQARATLDKKFKSRERALEQKAADIRTKQQKYEKDFPKLTDEQRAQREAEIGQAVDAFGGERASFETELSQAQNELLQGLLQKANKEIYSIAEQGDFAAIVQEVVYIKPQCDITQRVIDRLK